MDNCIHDLLAQNLIRPSQSQHASAPVLVEKSGGYRMAVDYRQLNARTKVPVHSMPRTDWLLAQLGRARWFSSASSSAEQPKLKSANSDGALPTPAPKKSSDRPRGLQGKRPGSDDGKDVPGTSNGIVASGVAERLGLMVSGATGIPISSTSKLHTTDTAPALRPGHKFNSNRFYPCCPTCLVSTSERSKWSVEAD
ncbi:hypothetical protein MRX96_032882 [Rhipicephalus microplus]